MTVPANYVTTGRNFYVGFELPLVVHRYPDLLARRDDRPMFSLGFLERGSAIVRVGSACSLMQAPSLWLLNETEEPQLECSPGTVLDVAYFHPSIVNSAFTPERLRQSPSPFEGTTFNDTYLLEAFLTPFSSQRLRLVKPGMKERIAAAFANIAREAETQGDNNWPCRTRSWLIELLFTLHLLDAPPEALPALPQDSHPLDRALLLVHERLNSRFTVEEMARWTGTNRTTLNAYFTRKTGQSVQTYVRTLRLSMASSLLRDTLLPIEEIVSRIGYEDASHFSRAFKRATGLTPSAYRAENCWMLTS